MCRVMYKVCDLIGHFVLERFARSLYIYNRSNVVFEPIILFGVC